MSRAANSNSPERRKLKAVPAKSDAPVLPPRKQYVLDTNVLLHDPSALFHFQEHDIYIPIVVLEELDRQKKGTADIARSARQVTRLLDGLLHNGSVTEGFDLEQASNGRATGRLYFCDITLDLDDQDDDVDLPFALLPDKADNQILTCTMDLRRKTGQAILVTNDINLRVKALASAVPAQEYRSDRVLSDADYLPRGFLVIDDDFWANNLPGGDAAFWRKGGRQYVRVSGVYPVNSFFVETVKGKLRLWRVESNSNQESVLYQVAPPKSDTPSLVQPKNAGQSMSLALLNDEDVEFVGLLGPAGTGKTLLAVAAGLEQVQAGRYREVLITRATVPLGEEIGFLPGTEEEKMNAWLGGTLKDTYSALNISAELQKKVEIASMSFMRGRSFHGKYIIIDEAQNLTIRQMRALLTRAGEGSKVVVTGNAQQIDTPYLDEASSGLVWAAKNLHNWAHAGHLILDEGVRSRLATYVEEISNRH